jgi:tetratricopeptide (TPR) repeat protein
MEIKKIIAILFLLQISWGFSQTNFEKGNVFYADRKFESAEQSYATFIKENPFDYAAYFNLGNSYFQQKKYALSLWSYEKSLLIKPNFKDAQINAKKAFEKTRQPGEWKNATHWVFRILFSVGINFWAYISIIAALLLFGGVFLYLKTMKTFLRKPLLLANSILVIILLGSTTLSGIHYKRLNAHSYGIVIVGSSHAKVAPERQEKTAFDIPSGRRVDILQMEGEWMEVAIDGQHSGWVPTNEIAEI